MLNQYLSHAVVQVLSKNPDYDYCCKRLSAIYGLDKQIAKIIIQDALSDALTVNDILGYVLSDIKAFDNDTYLLDVKAIDNDEGK
jgi:hypothetical protein